MLKVLDMRPGLKPCIFLVFSLVLMVFSLVHPPKIYGDGLEYFGIATSFYNHFSPDLRAEDISLRFETITHQKFSRKSSHLLSDPYAGYGRTDEGKYISFHFWLYSFLNTIPFALLKFFNLNPLKCFQVTNSLLIIWLLYHIFFSSGIKSGIKYYLGITTIISPLWLYWPWSHPEVYIFVLLFLGLLYWHEHKFFAATILVALASLQSQPVALVFFAILSYRIYCGSSLSSLAIFFLIPLAIILFPSAYYYHHFNTFNIISYFGMASTQYAGIGKAMELIFDLNFGLIIYLPVLVIAQCFLLFRFNLLHWLTIMMMLILCLSCSVQQNWNGGMMYMNRYSLWATPLLIVAILPLLPEIKARNLKLILLGHSLLTGIIVGCCLIQYDYGNYVRFGPVARAVLAIAPRFYNPSPEIFSERSMGAEDPGAKSIYLYNFPDRLRKGLIHNYKTKSNYINGNTSFLDILSLDKYDLVRLSSIRAEEDIFSQDAVAGFGSGWYLPEGKNPFLWRWMGNNARLFIENRELSNLGFKLELRSYKRGRRCKIIINNREIVEKKIGEENPIIEINNVLRSGLNEIQIISLDGTQRPIDIDNRSQDPRNLSFCITKITVY